MALDINFKILLYKDGNYAVLPHKDGLVQTPSLQPKNRFTCVCVCVATPSLLINTGSQTTNQPSSKLTKYQIISQQHTYMYIATSSEYSGSANYSNLVLWPGFPKF